MMPKNRKNILYVESTDWGVIFENLFTCLAKEIVKEYKILKNIVEVKTRTEQVRVARTHRRKIVY